MADLQLGDIALSVSGRNAESPDELTVIVTANSSVSDIRFEGLVLSRSDLLGWFRQLELLDATLKGTAVLAQRADPLYISLACKDHGHLTGEIILRPLNGREEHHYALDGDQTLLRPFIASLKILLDEKFPFQAH